MAVVDPTKLVAELLEIAGVGARVRVYRTEAELSD
jgi:hypothetical protein